MNDIASLLKNIKVNVQCDLDNGRSVICDVIMDDFLHVIPLVM